MHNKPGRPSKFKYLIKLSALLFFAFFISSLKQGHAELHTTHNVLIINSYHKGFTWTDNQVFAAQEVLESAFDNLEIHVEYMDTKRIYTKDYLEKLSQIYQLKYANIKLSAIITTDDNALRFVMRHHNDIFGGSPVSFCGINDYNNSLLKGRKQFTGLIEVLDIKPTIDLALKLHPAKRKVAVVVDSTPTGIGQLKEIQKIAHHYDNLEFQYLEGGNLSNDELLEKLRSLPKDSICLLTVWLRDKNNEYLSNVRGGELISQNASVPVYGIIDMYFSHGIVGGKLLNSATHGRIAAELAVRIIKGEKPSAIPVLIESTNPYMFDYQQLDRWGIKLSDLPAGSTIINKPFSFYKTYSKLIWITIVSFVILVFFISILLFNIIIRKKAEASLAESEERYRAIFEQANEAILLLDIETGAFIDFNSCAHNNLGYTREEFKKIKVHDIEIIENEEDYRQHLNKILQQGSDRFETKHRHKDGHILDMGIQCHVINYSGRKCILAIWTDMTAFKEMEAQVSQKQKMESVGTLAGGVAHEFNNILGGIIGYVEIAKEDAHDNRPVYESLEEILKLSDRARNTVKQILSFSRKDRPQQKPIQLSSLLTEELKVIRATVPTTIEIRDKIDSRPGTIMGDQTQIQQLVMNLCMNAAYAMEENGGVLEIGLSQVFMDAEKVKHHIDLKRGDYFKLTVRDTGVGIDPKIMDKIFDPFFTTKQVGEGTGMGLSVVHGTIKEHGGHISVKSAVGRGTTFTVLLPKADSGSKEVSQAKQLPTGTENILIVDDEEFMVIPQKKILERLGYKVTAMTSSLETLELFKKDPQRYDLIITDLTMSHLTGDRLSTEVTSIRPDMPVILSTGYADAVDSEKVKQCGIKAFIPKPCKTQDLAKTIRLILDEK